MANTHRNGVLHRVKKMTQYDFFGALAERGLGGFISLRSKVYKQDGSHKLPLRKDWTSSKNWDLIPDTRYGVGFALTRGLVVLDFDAKENSKEIIEHLRRWVIESEYPYAETPSGGLHILFRTDTKFNGSSKNRIVIDGVDTVVDIRTGGNQIVITEGLYKWHNLSEDVPILPSDIEQQLMVLQSANTASEAVRRFAEGDVYKNGERNEMLFRLLTAFVGAYYTVYGDFPDENDFLALVEKLNGEACEEPEEKWEDERTALQSFERICRFVENNKVGTSLLREYQRNPKRFEPYLLTLGFSLEDIPNRPSSQPVRSHRVASYQPHRGADKTEVQVYGLDELLALPAPRFLLDGVISEGDVFAVFAQPKVGKSVFCRQLAFSIATGTDFLGVRTTQRPVLYITNDEGTAQVQRHIKKLVQKYGKCDIKFAFANGNDIWWLLENTKDTVVFIDVVGKLFGDENSYSETTQTFTAIRQIAQMNGLTVIVVHHSNKQGGMALGSTAIIGSVDGWFSLWRKKTRWFSIDGRCPKKISGLPLTWDRETETYSIRLSSSEELIQQVREAFDNQGFVFADDLTPETFKTIKSLEDKGLVKSVLSQKGRLYYKLTSSLEHTVSVLREEVKEYEYFLEEMDMQQPHQFNIGEEPEIVIDNHRGCCDEDVLFEYDPTATDENEDFGDGYDDDFGYDDDDDFGDDDDDDDFPPDDDDDGGYIITQEDDDEDTVDDVGDDFDDQLLLPTDEASVNNFEEEDEDDMVFNPEGLEELRVLVWDGYDPKILHRLDFEVCENVEIFSPYRRHLMSVKDATRINIGHIHFNDPNKFATLDDAITWVKSYWAEKHKKNPSKNIFTRQLAVSAYRNYRMAKRCSELPNADAVIAYLKQYDFPIPITKEGRHTYTGKIYRTRMYMKDGYAPKPLTYEELRALYNEAVKEVPDAISFEEMMERQGRNPLLPFLLEAVPKLVLSPDSLPYGGYPEDIEYDFMVDYKTLPMVRWDYEMLRQNDKPAVYTRKHYISLSGLKQETLQEVLWWFINSQFHFANKPTPTRFDKEYIRQSLLEGVK